MGQVEYRETIEARGGAYILNGVVDERFTSVWEAFVTNFREEEELGAGCSVVVDGQTVVDLWGGWAKADRSQQWDQHSTVCMMSVAKGIDRDAGKEEFHRAGLPVMALPRNDPVLYFIQRLRDEAHRWAIGAHRAKRAKAVSATPLDDIPGVGATRKRALLAHFGSAKAVGRA